MSFSSFANVIRWTKDDIESPARYFDEDGNEITINQGKTWVCVVYDTKEDQIVIE